MTQRSLAPSSWQLSHTLIASATTASRFNGSMREALAFLRSASGDLDGGITEARLALDWATRHRMDLWQVMYRVVLAELLARRNGATDLTEARTILAETLPDAERLGMVGWVTTGADVLSRIE